MQRALNKIVRLVAGVVVLAAWLLKPNCSQAQIIFSDNFDSGASASWQNQDGNWTASGGVYFAQAPNNSPLTYTSIPLNLTDFSVDVDINNVGDGGVWLRSDATSQNGVLLVTGGFGYGAGFRGGLAGSSLYWHVVQNGDPGSPLDVATGVFNPGVSDPHLHIVVQGDTYSVYVDGGATLVTTLNTAQFVSGEVGLYDFSQQTFDNFVVQAVPEPGAVSLALLWVGMAGGFVPGGMLRSETSSCGGTARRGLHALTRQVANGV